MPANSILSPGPRFADLGAVDITLALFDVDNTLVGNESPDLPTIRFRDATLAAKGNMRIALASARPLSKTKHILEYIKADGLSILCNGAQIVNSNDCSVVAEWTLDPSACSDICHKLYALGILFWINDDGIDYFPSRLDSSSYERQVDIWDKNSKRLAVPEYQPYKPFVINASNIDINQVKTIEDMVAALGNTDITTLISHETIQPGGSLLYDLFIVHRLANKKSALVELARLENIGLDNIMAVGDGRNDAVLVGSAGVGIAMGNSAQETLDVATYIAPNRDDDGAAVALEFALQHFTQPS